MRDMPEELAYAVWAPPQSPWSAWVKPVLFAQMNESGPGEPAAAPAQYGGVIEKLAREAAGGEAALILNLPGVEAVTVGLALIGRGFRPIPLYNAAPGLRAVHNLTPLVRALEGGTELLTHATLPEAAPPAFLLDVHRCLPSAPGPGGFDNRWVVFPQDFPSAAHLLRHGIRRVVLVQAEHTGWQDDLLHVLRRWQEGGVSVARLQVGGDAPIRDVDVPRPSFFRSMYYRFMVMLKFRRNSAGGFGAIVPEPSQGGYSSFG